MRAILHIGTEKTGTTSIQSFLTQNRQALRQFGYAYLESTGLPSNRKLATYCFNSDRHDDHHVALGIVESEKRELWRAKFEEDFDREVRSLDESVRSVFISNEQLHSRLFSIEEIQRVNDILYKYFDSVEVFVYLRRQDKMACSLYSTALKCGHSMEQVLPQVPDTDHYYNYEVLLDKWSEVFGQQNITVRVFDRKELAGGDLLSDFLTASNALDIDLKQLELPGMENESLLPPAQEYLRLCNQVPGPASPRESSNVRNFLISSLEELYGGKPRLPTRAQATEFYQKFIASNNRVAHKWLDREVLFEEKFTEYPEEEIETGLDLQMAVNISMELLKLKTTSTWKDSQRLLKDIEADPAETVGLVADYFATINPALSRKLRQSSVGFNVDESNRSECKLQDRDIAA